MSMYIISVYTYTLEDERLEPTAITHLEKKVIFQTSWLCSMLIFRGVYIGRLCLPVTVTTKILLFLSMEIPTQTCTNAAGILRGVSHPCIIHIYIIYTWICTQRHKFDEICTYLQDSSTTKKRYFYPTNICISIIKPSQDVDGFGPHFPVATRCPGTTRQVQYQVVTCQAAVWCRENLHLSTIKRLIYIYIYTYIQKSFKKKLNLQVSMKVCI